MLSTLRPTPSTCSYIYIYSRVSFCNASHLRVLPSRTKHSRIVVHHCRKSRALSLLIALLVLFRCACVSSFSLYGSSFKFIVIFSPMTSSIKRKYRPLLQKGAKRTRKNVTLETKMLLMSKIVAGEKRKLKLRVIM
jgi:hypothetical protein